MSILPIPSRNTGEIMLAIFASGAGSNARKIIEHFRHHSPDLSPSLTSGNPPEGERNKPRKKIKVALIVCNKPGAGVLDIAKENHIPVLMIEKDKFLQGNAYADELKQMGIDFIVLAGFLWKLPLQLIRAFPEKIINIHPALLPAYGGKGMYGHFVHKAVIAAGEKESGITIHYVDELYDHGKIIFQARCPVLVNDTPETLAARIHLLEHTHYAKVIEEILP
jgi:phosphoribosylglycinamide formyltransferase 1